jgi:hypothetical protein
MLTQDQGMGNEQRIETSKQNHIGPEKFIPIQAGVRKIRRKGFTLKPTRKCVCNIKTDIKEAIKKAVDWIELFQEVEY